MKPRKTKTLRDARKAAGLTIQALAELSGVSYARILSIEQGRSRGNMVDQQNLADALHEPFRVLWPDRVAEVAQLMERLKVEGKTAAKVKS